MTINEFGQRSFVTHTTGLIERLAEKEIQMREIKFRVWNKIEEKMVYYDEDCSSPDMTLNGVLLAHRDQSNVSYIYNIMQFTGLCYEGDYVVMDCWNGGDGIDEPSHHDIFEGIIIYDKKICRFGLQTKLCDEGQIEVGLEDSRFTEIEILGNKWENPELLEQDNG